MFICLTSCLFVRLSGCLFVRLVVCLSDRLFVRLVVYLSDCLTDCLFVFPTVCPTVSLFVRVSVCLFEYQFVCSSVSLFVRLLICFPTAYLFEQVIRPLKCIITMTTLKNRTDQCFQSCTYQTEQNTSMLSVVYIPNNNREQVYRHNTCIFFIQTNT